MKLILNNIQIEILTLMLNDWIIYETINTSKYCWIQKNSERKMIDKNDVNILYKNKIILWNCGFPTGHYKLNPEKNINKIINTANKKNQNK